MMLVSASTLLRLPSAQPMGTGAVLIHAAGNTHVEVFVWTRAVTPRG